MAYRISLDLTPAAEVRRAAAQQLDRAVVDLAGDGPPDVAAVHAARKRIKKARSALRLIRADLPGPARRQANDGLRQAGRRLSGTRDADALVEAAEGLRAVVEEADGAVVARLRDALAERAERLRQEGSLRVEDVADVRRTLAAVADVVRSAPSRAGRWEGVEVGLRREHRRARAALAALPDDPGTEELHAWRKRVKDVWYHQRLLRDLWPPAQQPVVAAAHDLADLLGDDHDLAVLQDLLAEETDLLDGEDRAVLGAVVDAERLRLQGEARRLGARVLADRPGAWARRHRAWWRVASAGSDPSAERGTA